VTENLAGISVLPHDLLKQTGLGITEGDPDESDFDAHVFPGESREIDIESLSSSVKSGLTLGLHGWNVSEKVVKVGGEK
jgi:hypothetical protein